MGNNKTGRDKVVAPKRRASLSESDLLTKNDFCVKKVTHAL